MAQWDDLKTDRISNIDWLSDRIQPYILFKMPDGGWIEFPLGIFILSTPTRKEVNDQVYREVEAYDGLIILEDDKFINRYTIKSGTNYYDAMIDLLQSAGITKINIENTDKVLPNDIEFEPGIEKRLALNELAAQINYTPFWVDEYGYFTSSQYISPSDKSIDYEYIDDPEMSIVYNGMEENMDLFSIPNSWVATLSNVDGAMNQDGTPIEPVSITSIYTNDNPDSPTSTVSRGRIIVEMLQVENIADQASLDNYVQRVAFESSQVFGKIQFETAIMPFHRYQDVLQIRNSTLRIDGKYSETSWSIPLKAGAKMSHEVRKVVNI